MNHERLNDYICKLKILSKLEPREKIIIHERTIEIVDYTTYNLARLKKALKWEDRWQMITKLEQMYHDINSIVDNLVNNPPHREPEQEVMFALARLWHDLDGSLEGLRNLIVTYNSNASAASRLATLYEEVRILSYKINKFFMNRSVIDRKIYGVENFVEDSKKHKLINEFDPRKPEIQVSREPTPVPQEVRASQSGARVSTVPVVVQAVPAVPAVVNAQISTTTRAELPAVPPPPLPVSPAPELTESVVVNAVTETQDNEDSGEDTFSESQFSEDHEQESVTTATNNGGSFNPALQMDQGVVWTAQTTSQQKSIANTTNKAKNNRRNRRKGRK
jgi:hypothetical protein